MVDAKRAGSEAWLELNLQATASSVRELAQHCRGDSLKLLALLRLLESLHQEIREGLFQESLPDNRQALYSLLKDIETVGGWPYIHRMKLQLLLKNISTEANGDLSVLVEATQAPNPKDTTAQ
ncbi:hypothetical protein H6F43_09025 [Leptolyngbya sp. FACHB-36]|uniref:hypothetical protein n=1 Tax=Leptolyngbya sp. FACHB-36 TaxID=2692808 RepID=UPI00168115C1|nr:hypothetical protein [Leptolyngbya sp. FACHB-36]MBD2020327.1 hypothetical protein [Leptolyngbya sp. FACHB-36]